MFDQTFVNTGGRTGKPWTVAVSFALQGMVVGTALLVPILHPGLLQPKIDIPIWVHLQPMRQIVKTEASHAPISRHSVAPRPFQVPREIPVGVKVIKDLDMGTASENFAMMGPVNGSSGTDLISNLVPDKLPDTPPPSKVVKQAEPAPASPVAVSSTIQSAKLLFGPKPPYPPLARTTRTQGTVRIQAIIGADGAIRSLQVLSGPPLLIAAAKDAVSRWKYQATLLNGRAVEVITEVDVIFTLSN
jgi:protein TonB